MVNQSVQMATHVANYSRAGGVVVLYQKLFAVAMESIVAQTDIPVMLKLELVIKEARRE